VAVRQVQASGTEYLALVTRLLQRARLAHPEAGQWEAADLQWWWRLPRPSDELDQLFWLDDDGPVAAAVLTNWGDHGWGLDPLVVPGSAVRLATVLTRGLDAVGPLGIDSVDVLARDDDGELRHLLAEAGFTATDERDGTTWMRAEDRPDTVAPADGFAFVDRVAAASRPHPLRQRNGEAVEIRLQQCSLYDPELDLAVETAEGDVAGYALFWFDPVTEVGLVEPMRVEDAYQRRGLARALLTEGLARLAARGARRLKVSYGTEAARALYTGAGFRVTATSTTYRR
jgi:ribosomal protein S18 acetylase RimI-like enzyme